MLIGFTLIIVAVYLYCTLLLRLSVYALPLFAAYLVASAVYHADIGIIAALAAGIATAVATIAVAYLLLGLVKSDFGRAATGLVFALPAGLAGYHALHGIAAATIPHGIGQILASLAGSSVIAIAAWTEWSRSAR